MNKNRPLNIFQVTSEFAPLAKTGGLADVSAALSSYLHEAGHDVRVLMPHYATLNREGVDISPVDSMQHLAIRIGAWDLDYAIDRAVFPNGMTVFLLRCPAMFDRGGLYTTSGDEHLRFTMLSLVSIELCQYMQFAPDIFHCHDWHTGLVPLYLKTVYSWDQLFARTRSVMTIHNIGYQGVFGSEIIGDLNLGYSQHELHQDDLRDGRINFLKTALLHAHLLTTVSPTYAREIQGPEYGIGLDGLLRSRSHALVGILNGVDDHDWNPEIDPLIPHNYSASDLSGKALCKQQLLREMGLPETDQPLIGIVSRLVTQKGFDLLENALPYMLSRRAFSLVVLGSGEHRYEQFFEALHHRARQRVSFYRGYNNKLAHWIEAGSDMFLMPSRYEPCGLNQMYSLKYGTVPIVRRTGGLADSVQAVNPRTGSGTGVLFEHYDDTGVAWAMNTALDLYENKPLWNQIIQNGMSEDFSWQRQGARYVSIFRQLCDT